MQKTILDIEGMSCEHCVRHVTEALEGLDGVTAVTVSLADGQAAVQSESSLDEAAARAAIDDAGYEVSAIRAD